MLFDLNFVGGLWNKKKKIDKKFLSVFSSSLGVPKELPMGLELLFRRKSVFQCEQQQLMSQDHAS
jgi:hypothetical protein